MKFNLKSNLNACLPADTYKITTAMSIAEHAKLIYDIYARPYVLSNGFLQKRVVHGISHVSRVAYYVPVLVTLYFRYHNSLSITIDDLKLLQIAALFHDAGREGEEEDIWERDSATLLYLYLTEILKVNQNKAIEFAEVIANKDYIKGSVYHYLKLTEDKNDVVWFKEDSSNQDKTFFQQILHDADCLDIIRARDKFDAKYLDFYQNYVKPIEKEHDNQYLISQPMHEMSQLICEARSLIEHCGDTRRSWLSDKQNKYNSATCYELIQRIVLDNKHDFPVMSALSDYETARRNCSGHFSSPTSRGLSAESSVLTTSLDSADKLWDVGKERAVTTGQMYDAEVNHGHGKLPPRLQGLNYSQLDDELLVFRGVLAPSAKSSFDHAMDLYGNNKSAANVEMRMMHQRKDLYLNAEEDGNRNRSVSMIGHLIDSHWLKDNLSHRQLEPASEFENKFRGQGSGVYTNAGFGIRTSINNLSVVYLNGDADTGRGSKKQTNDDAMKRKQDLFCLMKNLHLGGINYEKGNYSHTELLSCISGIDCVIFSEDPNLGASLIGFEKSRRLPHGVAMLEALYLHDYYWIHLSHLPRSDVYDAVSESNNLPIYEYSGLNNTLKKVTYPTSDEILSIWKELANDYFKAYPEAKNTFYPASFDDDNVAYFKSVICYHRDKFSLYEEVLEFSCLDQFYPTSLKKELNMLLKDVWFEKTGKKFISQITNNKYVQHYHLKILSQYLQGKLEDVSTLVPILKEHVDYYFKRCRFNASSAIYTAFWAFGRYGLLNGEQIISASGANPLSLYQIHPSIKSVLLSHDGIFIRHLEKKASSKAIQFKPKTIDALLFTALTHIEQLEGRVDKKIYFQWQNAIYQIVRDQEVTKPETLLNGFYVLLVIHLSISKDNQNHSLGFSTEFLFTLRSVMDKKLLVLPMHGEESTVLQHAISLGLQPFLAQIPFDFDDLIKPEIAMDSLLKDSEYLPYIYNILSLLPKHSWGTVKNNVEEENLFLLLCEKLQLMPKNQNLISAVHIAVNNVLPGIFSIEGANGDTPLHKLCRGLVDNANDSALISVINVAIKKTPSEALSKEFTYDSIYHGETALYLLGGALATNPNDIVLIATLKLAIEKAPADVFSIELSNYPMCSGDTVLRVLCAALSYNPKDRTLIAAVKLAMEKASAETFSKALTNHPNLTGETALRKLCEVLATNPKDKTLIEVVKFAIDKAPAEAFSEALKNHPYLSGDTVLYELCIALTRHPKNNTLIALLKIAVEKAPVDVFSKTLTNHPELSGDTVLRVLCEALTLAQNDENLIATVKLAIEKAPTEVLSKVLTNHSSYSGNTALLELCVALTSNPKDERLIAMVKRAVEKAPAEAFSKALTNHPNLTGETALRKLCGVLAKNPKEKTLIEVVKLAIDKAPAEALSQALTNHLYLSGDTALLELCDALTSNPKDKSLIAMVKRAVEKASAEAFSKALTNDPNLTGETVLRKLCEALAKNPKNNTLIDVVKFAIDKAPAETLSEVLTNHSYLSGDTALRELCDALTSNPKDEKLIATVKLAIEKAPAGAFAEVLTNHPNLSGDTALLELCVALTFNSKDENLIAMAKLAVEKAPAEAFFRELTNHPNFSGNTALLKLCLTLTHNPKNENLIAIVKLAIEKASAEALSKVFTNDKTYNGETVFRQLCLALTFHPKNEHLIAAIKQGMEKVPAEAFSNAFTNHHILSGSTAFLELCCVLALNPKDLELIAMVKLAVEKAPVDAFLNVFINHPMLSGKTPLQMLCDALALNPKDLDLIAIVKLAVEKVPAEAFSKSLTNHPTHSGDTALRLLCAALKMNPTDLNLIASAKLAIEKAPIGALFEMLTNNPKLSGDTAYLNLCEALKLNPTDVTLIEIVKFVTNNKSPENRLVSEKESNDGRCVVQVKPGNVVFFSESSKVNVTVNSEEPFSPSKQCLT